MKKVALISLVLGAVLTSNSVMADLPTPSKNRQNGTNVYQTNPYNNPYQQGAYRNPYGNPYGYPYQYSNGNGNGASYYNNGYWQQAGNTNKNSTTNTATGSNDLLWLFTGSDAALKDQVKKGFHSNSDTSFGGRLFSVLLGFTFKKFASPFLNQLGLLEDQALNKISGNPQMQYQGNPYAQQGANYCYQCTQQQRSTNPYATNPYAVNQAVFNTSQQQGTNNSTSTRTTGSPSAGGIRR